MSDSLIVNGACIRSVLRGNAKCVRGSLLLKVNCNLVTKSVMIFVSFGICHEQIPCDAIIESKWLGKQ